MSFFTSFQELLDFDHSTNLNGFHFSNSLFGFDSNSLPTLENLPPPPVLEPPPAIITPAATNSRPSLATPSPIPRDPSPLLETPTKLIPISPQHPHLHHHHHHHHHQLSPEPLQQQNHLVPQQHSPVATPLLPIVSKFQLKVTPNNEIYISNESGTFCELAGSFVPSPLRASPEPIEPTLDLASPSPPPEPPKTLYCIERGVKRPLSPSDRRYCNSGIFRSTSGGPDAVRCSPNKKKSTSTADGLHGEPEGAKLVVSNVINNGLIVNKKHLSTNEEPPKTPSAPTPERRIMRPKKRKRKVPPKPTILEAKIEPVPNGRIITKIVPKKPPVVITGKRVVEVPRVTTPTISTSESALNFSGIKEKAAQEAIFSERLPPVPVLVPPPTPQQQPTAKKGGPNGTVVPSGAVVATENRIEEVVVPVVGEELAASPTSSSPAPVELKVVADLVMDKDVFGHISLLNSPDRGKTVIYQNPVTSTNVIYSILNPKSLNLSLVGVDRGTTATLTLQPHRGGRKPKKRGRKPKALTENGTGTGASAGGPTENGHPVLPTAEPIDPSVPVMVTRSGRLSKPPRYANNYFQNMKQKVDHSPPSPPPPPPPPPRLEIPAPDPETAEKLPNFSAALNSTTAAEPEVAQKRKMTVPLQYRCATCNKIYLGKRMQRHLQKYPSHNSARDCAGTDQEAKKDSKDEKSTYLYKHLFDLLQRFTEKDKGRIMLKEISNFVDFVRALIPRLITNDEQNSTVEYIDHNVADVLRLNHGKYRLKLSSLAEEYEKLNLLNGVSEDGDSPQCNGIVPTLPITSTPNADRQSFSFNADDLLNQSSSFPSLTTLMHEHNVLQREMHANNNHYLFNNNVPQQHQQQQQQLQTQIQQSQQYNLSHRTDYHHHHHHHLPLIGTSCHDDAINSLSGLCKSPVQHSAASAGMVNMALNLY